jgi:hypothetical protein
MDTDTSTPEAPRAPEEARVKFGPRADDSMPLSWASECLTWLFENNRPVFGRMMLARLGIETSARGRKPGSQ